MNIRTLLILLLVTIGFTACGNRSQSTQTDKSDSNNIPYELASNYFVRNDVDSSLYIKEKITSEEQFNRYFGMATTMSSKPTPIDFDNYFVIALILPVRDNKTILDIDNLKMVNDKLTLVYSEIVGERQSYDIHPFSILIVDKKYDKELEIVNH